MVEVSGTDPNSAQGGRASRQGTGGLWEVVAGRQYRSRRLVARAYLHPFSRATLMLMVPYQKEKAAKFYLYPALIIKKLLKISRKYFQ